MVVAATSFIAMILISRADILSDKIVEYTDPRRFLKIPVAPFLDMLGVIPIESQIALINAVNAPHYRFVCAALSRRQGKTFIANIIGQMVSLVPGSHILIMSPNYALSQISFELQRQLIKHFELEVAKDNAKDKVIELSNGSTVRMGSVNQVNSVVGRSYDLIIFDEAALTEEGKEAFNIALRPTLDKPTSKCIFISTPRGKNNWFAEFYDRGFSSEYPAWVSIKATWENNPRISLDDIEEARATMSKAEFEQEYECSFVTYEGQIWNLKPTCIEELEDLDVTGMDVIAGLDIGFRDATACVIVLYDWSYDRFYVVDEYYETEKTTEQHALAIREMMDKWNVDFAFIDSAAQQTKYDFAQMYDIATSNAKKSLLDGIGYVASLFDNDRVIIGRNCKHTLASVDQYQWDDRPGIIKERPKTNFARHIADALRYALYSFETSSMTV